MYIAAPRRAGVLINSPREVELADLREYHPWLRDRIAAMIQGDDKSYSLRGRLARGLVGSNGVSPSFGAADFTPAGVPLNAYDFGRHLANGEPLNALASGVNILPGALLSKVPGLLKKGAQTLTGAGDAAKLAPMAEETPSSIVEGFREPVNELAKPAIESLSRRGFLGGLGAVGVAAALPGVAGKAIEAAAPAAKEVLAPALQAHLDAALSHSIARKIHGDIVDNLISNDGGVHDLEEFQRQQHDALQASMRANENSSHDTIANFHPEGEYDPYSFEEHAHEAENRAADATDNNLDGEDDLEEVQMSHDEAANAHDNAVRAHVEVLHKAGLPLNKIRGLFPKEDEYIDGILSDITEPNSVDEGPVYMTNPQGHTWPIHNPKDVETLPGKGWKMAGPDNGPYLNGKHIKP